MSIELSREVGRILGSADRPPAPEDRKRITRAVSQAETFADLPKDIQVLIRSFA